MPAFFFVSLGDPRKHLVTPLIKKTLSVQISGCTTCHSEHSLCKHYITHPLFYIYNHCPNSGICDLKFSILFLILELLSHLPYGYLINLPKVPLRSFYSPAPKLLAIPIIYWTKSKFLTVAWKSTLIWPQCFVKLLSLLICRWC